MRFSGAVLRRPSLIWASYMAELFASIAASASLTHWRIGRSGWFAGTKSSSRTVACRLSLSLSWPRIPGSASLNPCPDAPCSDERRRWVFQSTAC